MDQSMPGGLAEFWLRRYKEVGHTGWKDPVIYAYDQIERLAIVSAELDSLQVDPLTAIDFGCGTGDFCRLMLEKGFEVLGYDPYVKPEISHPNFTYVAQHAGMDTLNGVVGLILSVTVLDHILDDQEFEAELTYLRSKISERGVFLMLEYALDKAASSSTYQAFRTIDEWRRHLSTSSWQISSIKPVPHPEVSPSDGFRHYRKSATVRLITKFSRFRFFRFLLLPLLTKHAQLVFNRYGIGKVDRSPLKLILCQPI